MAVLTDEQLAFLRSNTAAAMVTVGADGFAKTARIGVAVVDGHLWSSGTQSRTRTERLRQDPRCTLFVFDDGPSWVAVEGEVRLLEGDEGIDANIRLFRQMQDNPDGPFAWFGQTYEEPDFRELLRADGRLVYDLTPTKAYGLLA
jgi:general stress protein 26